MYRLRESQETLESIKSKALSNSLKLGTYNTRSTFDYGRKVVSFSDMCAKMARRRIV